MAILILKFLLLVLNDNFPISPMWNKNICNQMFFRKEVTEEEAIPTANATVLENQIAIYPNPSEGKITIKIPTESGTLIVTDMQGKQVGSYELLHSSTTLDMIEYPTGLYHLHITTPSKTYMFKLVLNK